MSCYRNVPVLIIRNSIRNDRISIRHRSLSATRLIQLRCIIDLVMKILRILLFVWIFRTLYSYPVVRFLNCTIALNLILIYRSRVFNCNNLTILHLRNGIGKSTIIRTGSCSLHRVCFI